MRSRQDDPTPAASATASTRAALPVRVPAPVDGLRSQLELIRARLLAQTERRLRGFTPTERDVLASVTAELLDEVLRRLEQAETSAVSPTRDQPAASDG